MYENFAWEQFLITGNLETFIEYRKIMQLNENNIYEKKDGVINEALDSGIFRLYSTSEDAIYKKTVALDEYLKNEAKIKALEAIKSVIENNNMSTPASEAIDREEEISKRATNMIKAEDYDQDFKNNVNKKILDDFMNTKKTLLEEDKLQKQNIIEQNKNNIEELEKLKKVEKPDGVKLIEKSKEYEKMNNDNQALTNIYDEVSDENKNLNTDTNADDSKDSYEDQPVI